MDSSGKAQPAPPKDLDSLKAELEKLEVPKMVIWVDKELKVETTNLVEKTIDEIMELVLAWSDARTLKVEKAARLDEINKAVDIIVWHDGGVPTKEVIEKLWYNHFNNRIKALGADNMGGLAESGEAQSE